MNDGGYGQELHSLRAKGLPDVEALLPMPRLDDVARAFGLAGARVHRAEDVDEPAAHLDHATGPLLVDVRVNREIVSPATKEIFAAVRRGIESTA